MLQELISYGNTGKESCLDVIQEGIDEKTPFGLVGNSLASKVLARFIGVFQSTFLSEKRLRVWKVLIALCTPFFNSAAEAFICQLEKTPLLSFVVEACENYPAPEWKASLNFLASFVLKSDSRQTQILKKGKVLSALLSVVLSSAAEDHDVICAGMWCTLEDILKSSGPLDEFIAAGGVTTLSKALELLVARGLTEYKKAGEVSSALGTSIRNCAHVLAEYESAAERRQAKMNNILPWSRYRYTLQGAQRYSETLNSAMYVVPTTRMHNVIMCNLMGRVCYLQNFTVPEDYESVCDKPAELYEACGKAGNAAVEIFLLTSGSPSKTSLLAKCIRLIRSEDKIVGEEEVVAEFAALSQKSALVCTAVEEVIGEKLVLCSQPGCKVSNVVRHRLKKCVRCMSVCYCGREHQVAHWKEHKAECKRVAAELQAAAAAVDVIVSSADAEVEVDGQGDHND